MTNIIQTSTPSQADIIGPYSPWPRRPADDRRAAKWLKPGVLAGTTVSVAVFLHCGLPLIA